jgi:hypothetical protein
MKYYSILFASIALVFNSFAHPALYSSGLGKRNPTGSFSLYAYQVASDGIKLFYADGKEILQNIRQQNPAWLTFSL